jgi:hypothetical protein
LWSHEGVTDAQREELIQEVFTSITIDGKTLFAIEPKSQYAPLFVHIAMQSHVGYGGLDSSPYHNTQLYLPSGILVKTRLLDQRIKNIDP